MSYRYHDHRDLMEIFDRFAYVWYVDGTFLGLGISAFRVRDGEVPPTGHDVYKPLFRNAENIIYIRRGGLLHRRE